MGKFDHAGQYRISLSQDFVAILICISMQNWLCPWAIRSGLPLVFRLWCCTKVYGLMRILVGFAAYQETQLTTNLRDITP